MVKNLLGNVGDMGLIPDLRRSHIGGAPKPVSRLLSLCSRAGELQLLSPCASTTEACET